MSPDGRSPASTREGGRRWSGAYAVAAGALGGLAFLPVPFFIFETWLGGVLGGAAAGLLTFPICFGLAWLARRRPEWSAARPDRRGAEWLLLAMALVDLASLWLAQDRWVALMIGAVALPPAVFAWIWGTYGWSRAVSLSMPVLFGWFALPWEFFLKRLDEPLQDLTTAIAHTLLNATGHPAALRDAHTLYWRFTLIVNETCSGMNMLMTLCMYALIFAWLTQPRILGRVAMVLLVFPVAMLANGLRVAVIFLLGEHGGLDLAMGFWHTGSAYLIFLPVFWFLYVTGNVIARRLAGR
jgi:exosortase